MQTVEQIADDIWEKQGKKIEALYLGGSRAIGAEESGSDYDFFGIVNDNYSFEEEEELNEELSEKYGEDIRLRGLSLEELNGGEQQGIITRHVPISVMLKSFPFWKHLRGKEYELKDFEVEPASPKEEAEFYLKTLRENRKKAERGNLPMPFEDYVKNVIRLIGAEEQLQGHEFTLDFERIVKRAPEHAKKLAEICLNYRKSGEMNRKKFFEKLDEYLQTFKSKYSI